MRHEFRPRFPTPTILAAAAASWLLAAGLAAQTPKKDDPATLVGEQRVTAVDTLLYFDRDGFSEWATGNATPQNLSAGDFEVLLGGEARPVVSLEAFEHLDAARRTPWTQLIYIDCRMISTANLRSALALLHRELAQVLAMGPVEVVLADPAPRRLLASTSDRAQLEALLSRLALDTQCRDTPQSLRDELLRLRQNPPQPAAPGATAPTPAELAATAREAELEAVRISTLGLLLTLSQEPRAAGAQKLVYLLHDGFDRRAADFYAQAGAPGESAPEKGATIAPLLLAKLVAAYGWTVMPVSESAFQASLRGAEIGRFLFDVKSGEQLAGAAPPPGANTPATPLDEEKRKQSLLGAITASLREKRDPDRAESYLELGQALAGQKKWAEAEDAFRKAVYHFDGAKKFQDREAKAWLGVGLAKAGQGDLASGRAATERAIELDGRLVETGEAQSAGLKDRALFLAGLAEATLGRAVVGEAQLRRGLADLGVRLRLTYQVAGDPDGRMMPLEVKYKGGARVKSLPWGRFGTPQEIESVRLLAALDDELGAAEPEGGLDLSAFVATKGRNLDLGQIAGDGPAVLRVSVLRGDPEGAQKIDHETFNLPPAAERQEEPRLLFGAGDTPPYLALLVENLETGEWAVYTAGD